MEKLNFQIKILPRKKALFSLIFPNGNDYVQDFIYQYIFFFDSSEIPKNTGMTYEPGVYTLLSGAIETAPRDFHER